MTPITLEVFSLVPTAYFQCAHCERLFEQAGVGQEVRDLEGQYPPEFLEESQRLAAWLEDLQLRHGPRISIEVVDPQSPAGLVKSLRYWVRRYPTFVVNRREKYTGWDRDELEAVLLRAERQ